MTNKAVIVAQLELNEFEYIKILRKFPHKVFYLYAIDLNGINEELLEDVILSIRKADIFIEIIRTEKELADWLSSLKIIPLEIFEQYEIKDGKLVYSPIEMTENEDLEEQYKRKSEVLSLRVKIFKENYGQLTWENIAKVIYNSLSSVKLINFVKILRTKYFKEKEEKVFSIEDVKKKIILGKHTDEELEEFIEYLFDKDQTTTPREMLEVLEATDYYQRKPYSTLVLFAYVLKMKGYRNNEIIEILKHDKKVFNVYIDEYSLRESLNDVNDIEDVIAFAKEQFVNFVDILELLFEVEEKKKKFVTMEDLNNVKFIAQGNELIIEWNFIELKVKNYIKDGQLNIKKIKDQLGYLFQNKELSKRVKEILSDETKLMKFIKERIETIDASDVYYYIINKILILGISKDEECFEIPLFILDFKKGKNIEGKERIEDVDVYVSRIRELKEEIKQKFKFIPNIRYQRTSIRIKSSNYPVQCYKLYLPLHFKKILVEKLNEKYEHLFKDKILKHEIVYQNPAYEIQEEEGEQ